MKVLIHSNAPWMPSGYGKQAAIAGRMLIEAGHQVSFSAFAGLGGQPITWQVPGVDGRRGQVAVYPSGQVPFSPDVIVPHARAAQADLIVSLMDSFKLAPAADELRLCGIPHVPLIPVDCMAANGGPSVADQRFIGFSGALPAAVSKFGHARLEEYGPEDWEVPYVPHAVDTVIYQPPADRKALREEMGTSDFFVIGICAANRDGVRKGFPEQLAAFERFARRHDDARLALFTMLDSVNGLPLAELINDFGLLDKVIAMPGYEQVAGLLSEDFMAHWYGALDILSNCGYGEGFGVPLIEAQACGTPVVATDCSAMSELARPAGWLVGGHRFWNAVHRAWWTRPDENQVVRVWESAYQESGGIAAVQRSTRAMEFAQDYGLEHAAKHWASLIRDVQDWQDSRNALPKAQARATGNRGHPGRPIRDNASRHRGIRDHGHHAGRDTEGNDMLRYQARGEDHVRDNHVDHG